MSDVVVVTDTNFADTEVERSVLERAGFELRISSCTTPEEVIEQSRDATGLLVQFAPITAAVFDALPQLRAVVRYGTGLDNVDLEASKRAGVRLSGVDGYCTSEVADHTMALLLCITRGLVLADAGRRAGEWWPPYRFRQVRSLDGLGMTLIGFGRIGRAVAKRARAFNMRVCAYDPYLSAEVIEAAGVEPVSLEDGFEQPVVSLHLPLQQSNTKLVDAARLDRMPAGGILLNVSRGGLVDQEAVVQALDNGRLAAVGLDVLAEEPPAGDDRLFRHPRAVVTPHIGFYSDVSLLALRRQAAETLAGLLRG